MSHRRPNSFLTRISLAIFFLCGSLLVTSTGLAKDKARIMVDPNLPLFVPQKYDKEYHTLAQTYRRGAEKALKNYPERFSVLEIERLLTEIESDAEFQNRRQIASEWAEVGIEKYYNLDTQEAIDDLEKALKQYRSIAYDFVAPEKISRLSMYLALAYLEIGNHPARATALLKDTVRMDPTRRLKKGYYPAPKVASYRSARESLIQELVEYGPDRDRTERLQKQHDIDFTITGFIAPARDKQNQFAAYMYLYHSREGVLGGRELNINAITNDSLERASKKLTTRLLSATRKVKISQRPESRTGSTLSTELNFSYGSFLKYPELIEYPFGHFGASFGVNYQVNPNFYLHGRFQFLNSIPDYNGLILNTFTTLRGFIGPQIRISTGPFEFGASLNIETTRIGAFQVCGNLDNYASGCNAPDDRVTFDDSQFILGANFRTVARMKIYRSIGLRASIDSSYYFYPFRNHPLNFPLTAEIGVEYQF